MASDEQHVDITGDEGNLPTVHLLPMPQTKAPRNCNRVIPRYTLPSNRLASFALITLRYLPNVTIHKWSITLFP